MLKTFRLMLRDYFDLNQDQWGSEALDPHIQRIRTYIEENPAHRDLLEEALQFVFLDPTDGVEELIAGLMPDLRWLAVREEIELFGTRRPQFARNRHVHRLLEAFDGDY